MGIVVAWQQMPLDAGELTHPFKRFKQCSSCWGFCVIDIAGNNNAGSAFSSRQPPDILDRSEARLPKNTFPVAKLLEWLPYLPVCRVNEAQNEIFLFLFSSKRVYRRYRLSNRLELRLN
jgi:hypothetical protein